MLAWTSSAQVPYNDDILVGSIIVYISLYLWGQFCNVLNSFLDEMRICLPKGLNQIAVFAMTQSRRLSSCCFYIDSGSVKTATCFNQFISSCRNAEGQPIYLFLLSGEPLLRPIVLLLIFVMLWNHSHKKLQNKHTNKFGKKKVNLMSTKYCNKSASLQRGKMHTKLQRVFWLD